MTALPQERRVVTAIPGPKSQELQARRAAAVAAGVGSVLPVFTARAGGGIIEDVDGNRLIDFGSGIAVTSVGASAEAVVRRASAQLAGLHPHLFHGHAVRGVRRGLPRRSPS